MIGTRNQDLMQPEQPFTWGAGGARMTPEQIDLRQKAALAQQAAGMDMSPVGSWTQGLARVAQALVGNLEQRRVDKAMTANQAGNMAALAAISGGNDQAILAALSDPYSSDGIKKAAELRWQDTHRAPPQPSEFERAVAAGGIMPGTPEYQRMMRNFANNRANPVQAVPGVDEQGNQVLRFIRPQGGGDPSSTPAGGTPPATLPPEFFDKGGPTHPASATFP